MNKFGEPSLIDYFIQHRDWSAYTFGPRIKTEGILAHIAEELEEIRNKPEDLEEWADVIILALDGFWRNGGSPNALWRELLNKQGKNKQRKWPTPVDGQPTKHVKEPGE